MKLTSDERLRPNLLGLLGVSVLSGVLSLLSGCGDSHSTAIERVLQADQRINSAKSVADVVTRMRAIDQSACPNDFKAAYLAHIHAWEGMAVVERKAIALKQDSESAAAMFEAFIRGFFLDPFGKANEIKAEFRQLRAEYEQASREIKQTFEKVEQIAVAHGAKLPTRK